MIQNPDLFAIYVGFASVTGEEVKGRISLVKHHDGTNQYFIRPLNKEYSVEVDPHTVKLDLTAQKLNRLNRELKMALHDEDMELFSKISKEMDEILKKEKSI